MKNYVSHAKYAETDKYFRMMAKKAGVEPTRRQAAKFRRGEGLVFKTYKKYAE